MIVDDASTDDSASVVERFLQSDRAGGRFRLHRHSQNEGQMAAFQTGLGLTSGSFVVFVDADDFLFPDFLEAHIKAHLNSARLAAFTNSEQLQISADGQVISGIQGLAGTPDLRSSRAPDGHRWSFSATRGVTLEQTELPLKYFEPLEIASRGWIWSTTSATMFRRPVLDLIMSPEARTLRICADRYVFNFSHCLGGSMLIRSVHGCYRRHAVNGFATNPVLGGDCFIGDNRKDPAELANALIFQRILRQFALFCTLAGKSHTIAMLRHFGPRRRWPKLKLALTTVFQMIRDGQLRGATRLSPGSAPARLTPGDW